VGASRESLTRRLEYDVGWRVDDTGPLYWDKVCVSGIKMPKYDKTICTGCSNMFNPLLMLLTAAYKEGATEKIEVLTGKRMTPSPGFSKTILFGNCMIKKNRNDPNINDPTYIRGCPVTLGEIITKLQHLGLRVDLEFFAKFRKNLSARYDGKPDFVLDHYFMPGATGDPRPTDR
jgi:hypothetical protein